MCRVDEAYAHLTSFEMVMHCLKYSGKQSSTTNANMRRRFDLAIISTPYSVPIQVVSVFPPADKLVFLLNIYMPDNIYN